MTQTVASAQALASALLAAVGMDEDRADTSARCIVMADVWGIGSHGLLRLPFYLQRMTAGGYPPDAELGFVADTGPVVSVTGGGGLGHWQLWQAAELAVTCCREYGIGAVSVADSGHCGALGLYTVPGLRDGMLTLAFSNGPAVMPPWGGAKPLLSTSPIAAGIPTRPRPAIVDMATSAVARGKIAAHARAGTTLPEGWALAADGSPTVDPQEALYGMLAPLGGAKGFALALLVESVAGGLAGPSLSAVVPDMFTETDAPSPQRIGHVLLTLDPARFTGDGDAAATRLERLAASVEDAGGRLPGRDRVLPEDVDPSTELVIDDKTLGELHGWAERLGVAV